MVHEYLLSYIIDTPFHDMLARKMLSPWNETHGSLVKIADTLSAYHEAKIESMNDSDFFEVYERLQKRLTGLGKGYMEELI